MFGVFALVTTELSTSTPANLLSVPAPAIAPVEALPDLLYQASLICNWPLPSYPDLLKMHHSQVCLQLEELQCLTLTSKPMRPGCNLPSVYPVPAYHSKVHQWSLTLSNNATSLQPGSGSSSQTSVPGQHLVDQTISIPCRSQNGVRRHLNQAAYQQNHEVCWLWVAVHWWVVRLYLCGYRNIYTLTFSSGQTISRTKTYFHPFQPCIKGSSTFPDR